MPRVAVAGVAVEPPAVLSNKRGEGLSLPELKSRLKELKLPTSGTKPELVTRYEAAAGAGAASQAAPAASEAAAVAQTTAEDALPPPSQETRELAVSSPNGRRAKRPREATEAKSPRAPPKSPKTPKSPREKRAKESKDGDAKAAVAETGITEDIEEALFAELFFEQEKPGAGSLPEAEDADDRPLIPGVAQGEQKPPVPRLPPAEKPAAPHQILADAAAEGLLAVPDFQADFVRQNPHQELLKYIGGSNIWWNPGLKAL
ncbi:unnamed protein product, partial [Polarella glacialis]